MHIQYTIIPEHVIIVFLVAFIIYVFYDNKPSLDELKREMRHRLKRQAENGLVTEKKRRSEMDHPLKQKPIEKDDALYKNIERGVLALELDECMSSLCFTSKDHYFLFSLGYVFKKEDAIASRISAINHVAFIGILGKWRFYYETPSGIDKKQ